MVASGPTRASEQHDSSWSQRPWLARLIRLVAYLGPTVASFLTTFMLTKKFPPHVIGIPVWLWWIAIFVIGVVVLLGTDKLARKLLPLAALFKLSLVFPDEAPNRFGVAMRSGTTRQLQRRIEEIKADGIENDETRYSEVMLELVAALSVHDRMTRGHCERVRGYTDMIVEEMGLDSDAASKLHWAALLHDVGKLFVPSEVLSKDGKPNKEEWELLKSHTWQGDKLIEPLKPWLGEWAATVGSHHERWDGNGYPEGLAAGDIHLGARIVAVADAFDVMTSTRSYKKPIPAEDARAEIARCAGSQFDPGVVRAFLNIGIGRLRFAIGPLSWAANIPAAGQAPITPVVTPIATAATAGVTAIAATITGGFGGALIPESDPAPDEIAFVDEVTTTSEVPVISTTIVVPATVPPTGAPTTTPPTTVPPTTRPSTTRPTTARPATTTRKTPTTTARRATTTTAVARSTTSTTQAPAAPIALAAILNGTEDNPIAFVLQADSETGPVNFSVISNPAKGSVALSSLTFLNQPATSAFAAAKTTTHSTSGTYTPASNASGTDSFTYRVCETSGARRCSTATVAVNVSAVNDPPTVPTFSKTVFEDTIADIVAAPLLAEVSDVDGDPLSITWGSPPVGTLTVLPAGANFEPPLNFTGSVVLPLQICDGTVCVDSQLTLTFDPSNDAPVASDAALTGTEDVLMTVDGPILYPLVDDSDHADAELEFTFSPVGANGTLTPLTTGFTMLPNQDYDKTILVDYEVCDPATPALCDNGTLTLVFTAQNDAPVLDPIPDQELVAGVPIAPILIGVNDPDNSQGDMTITVIDLPGGLIYEPLTHKIMGTPDPSAKGSEVHITVSVSDGATPAATDTITFHLNFKPEALSLLSGKLAITEVLASQTRTADLTETGVHDEFIELTNIGPDPINLGGLQIVDFDLSNDTRDSFIADTSFDYIFPNDDNRGPTSAHDGSSTLQPGEVAVLWMGEPNLVGYAVSSGAFTATFSLQPFPHAPEEAREYYLGQAPWPLLESEGDDIWLYDSAGNLIDYVAWNSGSSESDNSGRPEDYLGQWGSLGDEANLANTPSGTSISLTTHRAGNSPTCWSPTQGAQNPACPGVHLTLDTDPFEYDGISRDTSVGVHNIS